MTPGELVTVIVCVDARDWGGVAKTVAEYMLGSGIEARRSCPSEV